MSSFADQIADVPLGGELDGKEGFFVPRCIDVDGVANGAKALLEVFDDGEEGDPSEDTRSRDLGDASGFFELLDETVGDGCGGAAVGGAMREVISVQGDVVEMKMSGDHVLSDLRVSVGQSVERRAVNRGHILAVKLEF